MAYSKMLLSIYVGCGVSAKKYAAPSRKEKYIFVGFFCRLIFFFFFMNNVPSLNFWVEACWFLSLRVFGLLSSWLTESEQATSMDSIKDVSRSSVKGPEFDKHLKKAGGHIGRNFVEITIKMKTIVRKPLMMIMCQVYWIAKWIDWISGTFSDVLVGPRIVQHSFAKSYNCWTINIHLIFVSK